MEDIEHYNIPIYNFPYDVEEDDEDTIEENSELRVNRWKYLKKMGLVLTKKEGV
jgi:hypothetical protein